MERASTASRRSWIKRLAAAVTASGASAVSQAASPQGAGQETALSGYIPIGALGVANLSSSDQTSALTRALSQRGRGAVTLFPFGTIRAQGATHQPWIVLDGVGCTIMPPDGVAQKAFDICFSPEPDGDNISQDIRFGKISNLLIQQSPAPGPVDRMSIGYSAKWHNRFYADTISIRGFPVAFDIRGVNYARLNRLSIGNAFIGLLIRNLWNAGGSTDFSVCESNTTGIKDPTGSNSGIAVLISDEATTGEYGLAMNNIQLDKMHFNTSATCHLALVSVDPRRQGATIVTLSNSAWEYLHSDAVDNEAKWLAHPRATYTYVDPNPKAPFGRSIRKTIKPAAIYIETGRLHIQDCAVNDARCWVGVLLDGAGAEVHWKDPGIGGSQDAFGVKAEHVDARAYLYGICGIGRYQNVQRWPDRGPWSWGFNAQAITLAGVPTSRRAMPPEVPRYLHSSISAEAPAIGRTNIEALSDAVETSAAWPINGAQVRKLRFAAGAWKNGGMGKGQQTLSTQALRGGNSNGHAENSYLPYVVSALVRIEQTTKNMNVELRWDIWTGKEGRQVLAPDRWYRIFIGCQRNSDTQLFLWSATPGVGFDLMITRLAVFAPGAGAAPLLDQVLSEGIWVP